MDETTTTTEQLELVDVPRDADGNPYGKDYDRAGVRYCGRTGNPLGPARRKRTTAPKT